MGIVEAGTGLNTEIQDFSRIHRHDPAFAALYLRRPGVLTYWDSNLFDNFLVSLSALNVKRVEIPTLPAEQARIHTIRSILKQKLTPEKDRMKQGRKGEALTPVKNMKFLTAMYRLRVLVDISGMANSILKNGLACRIT